MTNKKQRLKYGREHPHQQIKDGETAALDEVMKEMSTQHILESLALELHKAQRLLSVFFQCGIHDWGLLKWDTPFIFWNEKDKILLGESIYNFVVLVEVIEDKVSMMEDKVMELIDRQE